MTNLKKNLEQVKTKIAYAALKSGRLPDEVNLVAVTKTEDVATIKQFLELGTFDIGENRVQDAWEKYQKIGDTAIWHMIGRLQKNKAKYVARFCKMIHSVESYDLACELDKEAKKNDRILDVLVQVNVSGEEVKQGVVPDQLVDFVEKLSSLHDIRVKGLMTMAPFSDDPEISRPVFRGLRELKIKIDNLNIPNVDMKHLSMGMSQDYEVAIQEGATIVRVGGALFLKNT